MNRGHDRDPVGAVAEFDFICPECYQEGLKRTVAFMPKRPGLFIHRALISALMLAAAAVTLSCRNPTAPTFAAITALRYEHVIAFSVGADMRVDLEYWNCGGGPLDGPGTCALTRDQLGVFRCQDPSFLQYMQRVPTTCEGHVDVRILSPTGNPLVQVAHDIYLNEIKVTRITSNPASSYPFELGFFRLDASGRIE